MRVPIRKPGKYTHYKPDPQLTEAKFNELKNEQEKLKTVLQPQAITEVRRLAELGDFSENAAYQIAKGRLRGINQRLLDLDDHLKRAVIIKQTKNAETVQLGNGVTVEISGKQKTYLILGSSETDPARGIISHNSPLGSALLGHKVGDTIMIRQASKEIECRIIKIG